MSSNTNLHNVSSTSSSAGGITILVNGTEPEYVYTELPVVNNTGNGFKIISTPGFDRNVSLEIDGCYTDNNLNGERVTAAVNVKFLNCHITRDKYLGDDVNQNCKDSVEFHSSLFSQNVDYAMQVIGNHC